MNSGRLGFPATADLDRAGALSPAVARYRALCEQPASLDPADALRQRRHREWLSSAVPALLGGTDPALVCSSWSAAAEALLVESFRTCFTGKIALFAFGKLGSRELNLSSDVDIVLVAAEEDPNHLKELRAFQKLLSELRPSGFVLRTDFDLRPGGRMGPLVPTVDHFVDYYGNYGETWERMAFVRFRALAGDGEVVGRVEDFAARFSYRRHLDYGLLEDLKSLRARIHDEHWKRSAAGFIDLKLGVGGIRDVELFFHALQIIHGGKNPRLRVGGTGDAANSLAAENLLPADNARFLLSHYWRLREIENYVQAIGDEQTHRLDPRAKHPDFIERNLAGLSEAMSECSRMVATLLGEPPPVPTREALESAALGAEAASELEEILKIPLLSRNREKDEGTRKAFLSRFLGILAEQKADSKMAVEQLKDFLQSTRAKSSFFNLLNREEGLMRELAWLFGHSRYLGRLLCYRPELLDAFVYRSQDLSGLDLEGLLEALVEKRLLAEIIEGSRFLRDHVLPRTTAALTSTADGIVLSLARALRIEYPSDIRLLALGKWGGRELGFRSDLDFIFVSKGPAGEADHRFARRFISRLTEPHRGGNIYPIDMRLRPSGKAGPIVMPEDELLSYLREEAAAWERQAYLRARWIGDAGPDLREAIFARTLTAEDLAELERIRKELLPKDGRLDLKYSEGGLVDLELFAQAKALKEGAKGASGNTMELLLQFGLNDLYQGYLRLRQTEQLGQLIAAQSFSKIDEKDESLQILAALLNLPSKEELRKTIEALLADNCARLGILDPRRTSG